MATATREAGFYATDYETYYVTPGGAVWLVASEDIDGVDPLSRESVPADAVPVDHLLAPDEAIGHCRRIEAVSDERLIEG